VFSLYKYLKAEAKATGPESRLQFFIVSTVALQEGVLLKRKCKQTGQIPTSSAGFFKALMNCRRFFGKISKRLKKRDMMG